MAVSDNTGDAVWQRRCRHRLAGVLAAQRSRDFNTRLAKLSAGEQSQEGAPLAPDPEDRSVSKRQWERSMQQWRQAIRAFAQSGS